jgi:hypothetical protein
LLISPKRCLEFGGQTLEPRKLLLERGAPSSLVVRLSGCRTGCGLRSLHGMPEVRLNAGVFLYRRSKLRLQQSDFLPGLIYVA